LIQAPKSEQSKMGIFLKPYQQRTWTLFFSNLAPYFSKQALSRAMVTLPYRKVCNMGQLPYNCTDPHNLIEHCQFWKIQIYPFTKKATFIEGGREIINNQLRKVKFLLLIQFFFSMSCNCYVRCWISNTSKNKTSF